VVLAPPPPPDPTGTLNGEKVVFVKKLFIYILVRPDLRYYKG